MRPHMLCTAMVAASIVALPLIAQAPAGKPGAADPTRISGGAYVVEPSHSQILFSYDHMGFSQNIGLIAMPTGTLTLDPKNPSAAKVSIVIPVANIRTGIPKFDEHLMATDYFDAARFPTATFVSTSVKAEGSTAAIRGNLTIKDKTVPVTLNTSLYGTGISPIGQKREQVGFIATGEIKRGDFGMGQGVPIVDDVITLKIVIAFEKAGAA